MSHPDFDPALFGELIEGARRTACCDEAELRTHQLRNERAGRMLSATYEPVHWGWVFALILLLCVGVFSIGHNWPVSFNPFAR